MLQVTLSGPHTVTPLVHTLATERNGIVYVFMGDAAMAPPLPDIAATHIPEEEAEIVFLLLLPFAFNYLTAKRALLIGMAGVFLFMIVYYRVFGVVSALVLLANVVLLPSWRAE